MNPETESIKEPNLKAAPIGLVDPEDPKSDKEFHDWIPAYVKLRLDNLAEIYELERKKYEEGRKK